MSRLEQATAAVARYLGSQGIPYMVIGGVANALLGIPRATLDVDVTVWVAQEGLEDFVRGITQSFSARTADAVGFAQDARVLPLETKEGIRVDVIFAQLPYEEEAIRHAAEQVIEGVPVRVCRPEDLVLYKVISERLKDREDVRGVILQQRERLNRDYLDPLVASLAQELSRPDIREWYDRCLQEAGLPPVGPGGKDG